MLDGQALRAKGVDSYGLVRRLGALRELNRVWGDRSQRWREEVWRRKKAIGNENDGMVENSSFWLLVSGGRVTTCTYLEYV
jgi:hypothetical protein